MELQKVKSQRKNKRYSFLIALGISLLFFSATYFIYDHYEKERQDIKDTEKIEEFFEVEETTEEEVIEEVVEEKPIQKKQENYISVLEIPKIKLKRGLVDKNSSSNNTAKNSLFNLTYIYNVSFIRHITLPFSDNGFCYYLGCSLSLSDRRYLSIPFGKWLYWCRFVHDLQWPWTVL